MMTREAPYDGPAAQTQDYHAAVFVDYENLYAGLQRRLDRHTAPGDHVKEALEELRRYLFEDGGTQPVLIRAYADFGVLSSETNTPIERDLYQLGVQTRYVPTLVQQNASELHLCVEAVDVLHRRPDVSTFVVVTGDRSYTPLVQMLRSYGRRVLVVTLDLPPSTGRSVEDDVQFDLLNLLSEEARRALLTRTRSSSSSSISSSASSPHAGPSADAEAPPAPQQAPPSVDFDDLTDAIFYRTLEVAEEHFGQYDEVYLTPLLRKLSEVLGPRHDPKSLISALEAAGAVRLEKREGYPYDYTVLIVHSDHPDVQKIRAAMRPNGNAPDADHDEAFSNYLDEYADFTSGEFDDEGAYAFEDDFDTDDFDTDDFDADDFDADRYDDDELREEKR